ncbi:MAG: DNA protection during starvation protein 2 [Chlamydiae bacterium]|nr:DNA protection during starvation protein 2 [Chlamydiota bacterium]
MEPKIGIEKDSLKKSSDLLNRILADEMVLYVKTLNYHWNVRGHHFGPLHKLFKDQYEKLALWVDEIAERVRILGQDAPGTMKEFLELTHLEEHKGATPSEKEMLKSLLDDQEKIIVNLRKGVDLTGEEFHDMGTSDFLTQLMSDHEQIAWMTRAHLEG